MTNLRELLNSSEPDLYSALENAWKVANREIFPIMFSSDESLNSSPHSRNLENYLNGILSSYPNIFEDFNDKFKVKHLIEYIYDKWKQGKVHFRTPKKPKKNIPFTYQDPCRLSRYLPKDNKIVEQVREIFQDLKSLGYEFKEMEHNKENALCCGVNSWMNCNERSKALRYKRLVEAKDVGTKMITACPKCRIHLTCLKKDYEDFSSIEILDLSEFLVNLIKIQR